MMPPRALFLDRDGTLIQERPYLNDPRGVRLFPGAAKALAAMRAEGWRLVLITNQSGVGRGYFSLAQLACVHAALQEALALQGVQLDGIYVCPHWQEPCNCRKPQPGLLWRAAAELNIVLPSSVVIGDSACDLEAAKAAGCRKILVLTGKGAATARQAAMLEADHLAADLPAALRWLRQEE